MSSARLPGKVLRALAGKPLLQYVLERLEKSAVGNAVLVATSTDPSDDPVAAFCDRIGIAVFRGPLADVAGRFLGALDSVGWDAFARVNGDSPLIDQQLVDKAVDIYRSADCEIVTNVLPRTYPPGQSVELVRGETFRRGYARMNKPEHFEHVTKFFYEHANRYRIVNFACEHKCAGVHLAVDTEQDWQRVHEIITRMVRPHWDYRFQDILALASAPE